MTSGLRARLLVSAALLGCGFATPALAQDPPAKPQQVASADNNEEAIIVTSQRRAQTLIEVPQSVSVLGGEKLEQQQAKSFLDYSKLVPGFYVTQDNPGQSRLVLRGINTGSVGSTVAVYVDDIPYGASGGDLGPLFNVMANVPLGDKVAVRASGYYKKTPGYVDVAGRSGKNVDDSKSYGLRGSLLFKPTEDLSIRLFA